jgi:hypothetical protein
MLHAALEFEQDRLGSVNALRSKHRFTNEILERLRFFFVQPVLFEKVEGGLHVWKFDCEINKTKALVENDRYLMIFD